MIKQLFNTDWTFSVDAGRHGPFGGDDTGIKVTLPHDAMIHERPTPDTPNGNGTGFYPGKAYAYTKEFFVPAEWSEKLVFLEFEGVYMNAMVFINDTFAGKHPYGYTGFTVSATPFLKFGEVNTVKVSVKNGASPNTRFYSGSGIYRDVYLSVCDKTHITPNGLRITTKDADPGLASVKVVTELRNEGTLTRFLRLETSFYDADNTLVVSDSLPVSVYPGETAATHQRIDVENPRLWSDTEPYLYHCVSTLTEDGRVIDRTESNFGIRTLRLDRKYGLRVNGRPVKLRGGCIHSDNGILGMCAFESAEDFKISRMKAAGFNAIRSAHNPASTALLNACDKYGVYVMDELSDIWNKSKTTYDYSLYFEEWWEKDAESMVLHDINHPSVIMYSTGNEIGEIGTPAGANLNRRIGNKFRALDDTRYVTNGLNGLFLGMTGRPRPAVNVDMNQLNAAIAENPDRFEDSRALHPAVPVKSEEAYCGMDIAGYNYMAARYEPDGKLFPGRVIVGSEDDPDDIVRLWSLVEKYSYVIGDFTWTGYDYLGEAGCGIYHYDGTGPFRAVFPDRASYIGDINLNGIRRPMSYFREIAYGIRKAPFIAVRRVDRYGQFAKKSKWMGENNIDSWTWPGYEGKPCVVDIFTNSPEAELFLNGRSLGRKPADNRNTVTFELTYEPGELLAVSYDGNGETGRMALRTAGNILHLEALPEKTVLSSDETDVALITVSLKDESGLLNAFADRTVSCRVEGAGVLAAIGSGNPSTEEMYDGSSFRSFDGRILAAVRSSGEKGEIRVIFSAENVEDAELRLISE